MVDESTRLLIADFDPKPKLFLQEKHVFIFMIGCYLLEA